MNLTNEDYEGLWNMQKKIFAAMEWQNELMGGKKLKTSLVKMMENLEIEYKNNKLAGKL